MDVQKVPFCHLSQPVLLSCHVGCLQPQKPYFWTCRLSKQELAFPEGGGCWPELGRWAWERRSIRGWAGVSSPSPILQEPPTPPRCRVAPRPAHRRSGSQHPLQQSPAQPAAGSVHFLRSPSTPCSLVVPEPKIGCRCWHVSQSTQLLASNLRQRGSPRQAAARLAWRWGQARKAGGALHPPPLHLHCHQPGDVVLLGR